MSIAATLPEARDAAGEPKPPITDWALRPFAVTVIITLFAAMASFYTYAVLTTVEPMLAVKLLWGSLIGEAIQAVLGFLFGYRSARK